MPTDDRLILLTRLTLWPLGVLAGIFGTLLFLLPGQTERLWSWPIRPDMSAVVVGAGYIFGAFSIISLLLRNRWHAVNVAIFPTWVFSLVMLAATLIHLDRFFVGTLRFDVWFFIYVALPIALPIAWLVNRRRRAPRRPGELVLFWPLRILFPLSGLLFLALGLVMVVYPSGAGAVWPWLLTPLMSRVIGGWVMFLGTGGFVFAFEPRYSAYRSSIPALVIWMAALLLGTLLHLGDFDFKRPGAWLWLLVVLGLLGAGVLGMALGEFILWRRRAKAPSVA